MCGRPGRGKAARHISRAHAHVSALHRLSVPQRRRTRPQGSIRQPDRSQSQNRAMDLEGSRAHRRCCRVRAHESPRSRSLTPVLAQPLHQISTRYSAGCALYSARTSCKLQRLHFCSTRYWTSRAMRSRICDGARSCARDASCGMRGRVYLLYSLRFSNEQRRLRTRRRWRRYWVSLWTL